MTTTAQIPYANFIALVKELKTRYPENLHILLLESDHTAVGTAYFMGSKDVISAYDQLGFTLMSSEGARNDAGIQESKEALKAFIDKRPEGVDEETAAYNFIFQSILRGAGNTPYHQHDAAKKFGYTAGLMQQRLWPHYFEIERIQHDAGIGADHITLSQAKALLEYIGELPEAKCTEVTSTAWQKALIESGREDVLHALNQLGASRGHSDIEWDNGGYIAQRADGRSSIINAGLTHLEQLKSALEAHTKGTVITIALFENAQSRLVNTEISNYFKTLPDYMYLVESDQPIALKDNAQQAEHYWARLANPITQSVPMLTRQEHDDCIARLGETLQKLAPAFEPAETSMMGGLPVRFVTQPPEQDATRR